MPEAHVTSISKQRIAPISYTRALMGGSQKGEGVFRDKIRARFGADVGVTAIGRARTGIYLLAKYSAQGARKKVLMSPFTLPDLVTMVILAGATPVFYDFEPQSTVAELANLQALIDDQTACVLITHYHVNEPRLKEIAALCKARGAHLFDDSALAFGGSIDGKAVGVTTEASVFSFSSFKLLNFFWGGMVTTQDPRITEFLEKEIANWPRLASRDYLAQAKRCISYDFASRPPFFNTLVFPMFQRKAKLSANAGGLENVRIESNSLDSSLTSRPSLTAFSEWNRKLSEVDSTLAKRREIAAVYRRTLGGHMVSARFADPVFEGSCFVNFPVIVPAEKRDSIWREMMVSGFDVGRNLYPNAHKHEKFGDVAGKSDNVDALTKSTIYLPTHFGVSPTYAEAIAARLLELLK